MDQNITMYGAVWCPDCKRSRSYLDSHEIKYNYIDIDQTPEAIGEVERINNGMRKIPTIVFSDGSTLVEPSNKQLAEKLGISE